MTKTRVLNAILYSLFLPALAGGQTMDVVGSRAAGMGGAFVGVANDASAVYWNPAGLALGSYFSMVLDGGTRKALPEEGQSGNKQSTFFLAASMPALGLSYYRIKTATATGTPDPTLSRVDTLVTHQAGASFVQSIVPAIAVGSTIKVVRGNAASELRPRSTAEEALEAPEPDSKGTTRLDLDVGVMATLHGLKAGFTVRNVREPEFPTPEGRVLKLERQARVGVSYSVFSGVLLAADLDLTTIDDGFGDRRDAAFGLEGRLASRAWVRTGYRFNTADDEDVVNKERRAITAGMTFAVTASVLVDALVISGGDHGGSGWGISGRFVY